MSHYTPEQRRHLLGLARQSIAAALAGDERREPARDPLDAELNEVRGLFVTLHDDRDLRGCVGTMEGQVPLRAQVWRMARSAAFSDPRFPPLTASELPRLHVEISILTPMVDTDPGDVVIGRDGLCISQGSARGVLLPQVAIEAGWSAEELLRATCRKARLPEDAWRDPRTRVQRFSAEVFGEE